jgi:signal transduction histidine kinase
MTLISDVLNHARAMDASDTSSRFNFGALCRDICDVLDPMGDHKFTYTSADVIADRTAMQIAVRNVIDNALKHGDREQLSIDIMLQRGRSKTLDVVLTDSGSGFSEAALAFVNGGNFEMESGYGLLGVRRMVQARGGSMTAQNIEGGTGAIIRFSMPGIWIGTTNSLGDLVPDWPEPRLSVPPKIA